MLNDKYEAALSVLRSHNEALTKDAKEPKSVPGYVDPEEFLACIKAAGGTSEERLKRFSYEDILECLPAIKQGGREIKPRILAKDLAAIFRGKDDDTSKLVSNRPISSHKADRMTLQELVQYFDPEEFNGPVAKRLLDISRGEPFIVFDNELTRAVNQKTTTQLLLELKSGYPKGRESITVDNSIKKVFKIGELPDFYVDENPLYVGRPLRPDGTCDQLNRSWEGVTLEIRQLIRLALKVGELSIDGTSGRERAHDILDMALAGDTVKLRQRYTKAAVAFDEAARNGNLPMLKVALQFSSEEDAGPVNLPSQPSKQAGAKRISPFSNDNKVIWKTKPHYRTPMPAEYYYSSARKQGNL